MTLKVICNEEIRLQNEFTGEGLYDYLLIKLSSDFLIYPEFGIGKKYIKS